jgi:hypothetical protein
MGQRLASRRGWHSFHDDRTCGQLLAAVRVRVEAVDGPTLVPVAERSLVHQWRSMSVENLADGQAQTSAARASSLTLPGAAFPTKGANAAAS